MGVDHVAALPVEALARLSVFLVTRLCIICCLETGEMGHVRSRRNYKKMIKKVYVTLSALV